MVSAVGLGELKSNSLNKYENIGVKGWTERRGGGCGTQKMQKFVGHRDWRQNAQQPKRQRLLRLRRVKLLLKSTKQLLLYGRKSTKDDGETKLQCA